MKTHVASAFGSGHWHARSRRFATAALLSIGLVALFAQKLGQAQTAQTQNPSPYPLPYSNGFLVTGNYTVGGVDADSSLAVNGFRTSTIPMSGVPANADILAAYLYWETIDLPGSANLDPKTTPVKFRGQPVVDANHISMVRAKSNPSVGASCYASGSMLTMSMFRADVLHLLQLNPNVKKPENRLVNDTDLQANGFALNTVTLPESGSGNNPPQSAGASLFVVYRDATQPLRKIVVNDGIFIQAQGATTTQTLQGFYKASATPSAKLTYIVG